MEVHHPDFGDMTEDVARELAALRDVRNLEDVLDAGSRQEHIAATCGTEMTYGKGGVRQLAQIDEKVFNYWEAREGRDFWKHELNWMLKRHPEMAVRARSANPTISLRTKPQYAVTGKRGRWAA